MAHVELNSLSGIELMVAKDLAERQRFGMKKYGVSLEDNPLSLQEWLQHAYEESLDKTNYLKCAIEKLKKGG